jgi:SAM-dependent methyltransferase
MVQTGQPDRRRFLDQRRAICRRRFDEIHAPIYDQRWGGYCNPSHLASLAELIEVTSPGDELLDAACGTGKHWPALAGSGRRIYGIDQSEGVPAMAGQKFPDVPVQAMALQELRGAAELAGRFCRLLCAGERRAGGLAGRAGRVPCGAGGHRCLLTERRDGQS